MIHRAEHTSNYTVISNGYLKDKRLSLKAKGIFTIILSLPDDWTFSVKGLMTIAGIGENSLNKILKELKDAGYIKITRIFPNKNSGVISYAYDIYEEPIHQEGGFQGVENQGIENQGIENQGIENQGIDYQGVENQGVDYQGIENHPLYKYTNIQNTNIPNTKESNTKQPRERKRSLVDMVAEYTENEELKTSLKDFIDMRKSIKKPLTERALKMIFNKLDNMAKEKDSLKVLILNQSVLHCWQDVYEYKGEDKKEEQKKKPEADNDPEFLAIFGL